MSARCSSGSTPASRFTFTGADAFARESSDGWANAGTGHAGLCELNYTPPPITPGAPVDVTKAVEIFTRFDQSLQFWSYAVAHGLAPRPADFIRAVPHLSFVRGAAPIAYLRARHTALSAHPFFRTMEFSTDRALIRRWAPLLVDGRDAEPIAVTKIDAGTDVNFGELARQLLAWLGAQEGCRVVAGHRVTRLNRADADWELTVRDPASGRSHSARARFVFIGAGGGTLQLLQSSGLPVAHGLAAFPIAGQWLVCENPAVVARHLAKVYGSPPPDSGALGGPTSTSAISTANAHCSSDPSPRGRPSSSNAPGTSSTCRLRSARTTSRPSSAPACTSAFSSAFSRNKPPRAWPPACAPSACSTPGLIPPIGASSTPASACRR